MYKNYNYKKTFTKLRDNLFGGSRGGAEAGGAGDLGQESSDMDKINALLDQYNRDFEHPDYEAIKQIIDCTPEYRKARIKQFISTKISKHQREKDRLEKILIEVRQSGQPTVDISKAIVAVNELLKPFEKFQLGMMEI